MLSVCLFKQISQLPSDKMFFNIGIYMHPCFQLGELCLHYSTSEVFDTQISCYPGILALSYLFLTNVQITDSLNRYQGIRAISS